MKRYLPHVVIYIMCAFCLALFITGGALLTAAIKNAHKHVGEHISATQPTCTAEGNTEFWYCETCGKYFSDELLTDEILQADTVLAQPPHSEETIHGTPATCTETGLSDGKRCTICKTVTQEQTVTDIIPHTEEIVIKGSPATCTEAGLTDGKRCTVCKTVTQEQTVIKALGHSLRFTEGKQSTCFEQGNPDYWYCLRCENYFAEKTCMTVLTQDEISYPLGDHPYKQCFNSTRHYKVATCEHDIDEKDGGKHNFTDKVCEDCGFCDYGFEYTLNQSGTAYTVTDRATYNYGKDVEIYGEFDGLPVTEIATNAFISDSMTSITLPDSITKINYHSFYLCHGLTEIRIPKNAVITQGAVKGCSQLSVIAVDEDNPYYFVNGNCLIEKQTRTLVLGCSGSVIPNDSSILHIGDYAFHNCKNMSDITIPDGVTYIGANAFYGCEKLTALYIPTAVSEIGRYAFSLCTGLESITVSYANKRYRAEGNCLIDDFTGQSGSIIQGCKNSVIPYNVSEIGSYAFYYCPVTQIEIPERVTTICAYAFWGCPQLTSLHIPENVSIIDDYAFSQLTALTEITVAPENQRYFASGNCLIEKSTKTLMLGCKNSVIPDDGSVSRISSYAFTGTDIQSIAIPSGVTAIGDGTFENCKYLTELTIPASVTEINGDAFYGTDIKNLYIEDLESWLKVTFNPHTYPYKTAPFQNGGNIYVNGELLTELIIPESITEVNGYTFRNCLSLTKVVIPDHVTAMDYSALSGCANITELYIGDGIPEQISFSHLKKLKTLVLGNGITEIGVNSFMNFTELTSVTLGDKITKIAGGAFYGCTGLTEIVLPKNLQMLYSSTFYDCCNLTTVTIGGNVTKIAANCFRKCTALTDIYYDGTKEQWLAVAADGWDNKTGEYTVHFNDGTSIKKGETA